MNRCTARVTGVTALETELTLLRLEAPEIARLAQPGQFVMVTCGEGLDPFLPRPIWLAQRLNLDADESEVGLLVRAGGRGPRWLAKRREDDVVELFGPLGRPLVLRSETRHLLLVAEGVHVAALLMLAESAVARGVSVALLQVAGEQAPVYPPALLPAEVEAVVLSAGGERPSADALAEYLRWADQIMAVAGEPLLRTLSAWLRTSQSRTPALGIALRAPAAGIPDNLIPCGTGICGDCVIETRRRGSRLICRDGPAFELRELY